MPEIEARRWFEKHALPFPLLPPQLARDLELTGEACFSTVPVDHGGMCMFHDSARDLLRTGTEDHAALSFGGHGVNSYAVTLQLVWRGVAAIVQVGWGEAYMDNDRAALELAGRYDQLAEVIGLTGRRAGEGRWVIVSSDMRDIWACGRLEAPLASAALADRWIRDHNEADPFTASIARLSLDIVRPSGEQVQSCAHGKSAQEPEGRTVVADEFPAPAPPRRIADVVDVPVEAVSEVLLPVEPELGIPPLDHDPSGDTPPPPG